MDVGKGKIPPAEMKPEYDIRGGVRGKYCERYRKGRNEVLLEPQRERIASLLAELEKEHGPVPPELMEEIRREWLSGDKAVQPSESSKARVAELVARERDGCLTAEGTSELEHYLQLEHIMRLAKARARKYL